MDRALTFPVIESLFNKGLRVWYVGYRGSVRVASASDPSFSRGRGAHQNPD